MIEKLGFDTNSGAGPMEQSSLAAELQIKEVRFIIFLCYVFMLFPIYLCSV